jgi:hypothetical protein
MLMLSDYAGARWIIPGEPAGLFCTSTWAYSARRPAFSPLANTTHLAHAVGEQGQFSGRSLVTLDERPAVDYALLMGVRNV